MESKLVKVFSETFNVPEERITIDTRQKDMEEWDSLGQLRLIMAIESAFDISFLMEEIPSMDSFRKLLDAIRTKKDEKIE